MLSTPSWKRRERNLENGGAGEEALERYCKEISEVDIPLCQGRLGWIVLCPTRCKENWELTRPKTLLDAGCAGPTQT